MAMAAALLVAQSLSFLLLVRSSTVLRQARAEGTINRFVDAVENANGVERILSRPAGRRIRQVRLLSITDAPRTDGLPVDRPLTLYLQGTLQSAGLDGMGATVAIARADPIIDGARPTLLLSAPIDGGRWLNFVQPLPPGDRVRIGPILFQTVVIYAILLLPLLLLTRRLSAPLGRLTHAARTMMTPDAAGALKPEGPADIRTLTTAFEEMRQRIDLLFAEKDVMLGAIGHDLRTPLTALRIRAESIAEETARSKFIALIDEMAALLDDILMLARRNGSPGARERVQLRAWLSALIADHPHGARIALADSEDVQAEFFPVLLRRGVRNLLDNALAHGEEVGIALTVSADAFCIAVTDDGPGVPDADISRIREAFVRGETSRNRSTGGAGLGLAIVERVAEAHEGRLDLRNRSPRGFEATLVLPITAQRLGASR